MNELTTVQPSFPAQINQEENPAFVPLPGLQPDQEAFILEVFRSQEQQKMYLAHKLHETEKERRCFQETMMRHAAALSYSIVHKFVETINKSPELQAMLGIKPNNKTPLKLDELVEKLELVLKEESPPQGHLEDKELQEWIWCKRGIEELLQPIVNDINTFLKTFGVENLKKHCPEILEKDLEEQLRLALNPAPTGPTKWEIAGKGLKGTFWILYYMCGMLKDLGMMAGMGVLLLKSPSVGLIQIVATTLIKILVK